MSYAYVAGRTDPAPNWPLRCLTAVKEGASVYPLFRLATSTPKKFAGGGFGDAGGAALGQYEARVIDGSWPALRFGPQDLRSFSLDAPRIDLVIDDGDRSWAALVQGATGSGVWRAVATIVAAIDGVDSRLWPTVFVGILETHTRKGNQVTLTLRNNDLWLQKLIPQRVVSDGEFRTADPAAKGKPYPLLYGIASSADGGTGTGAIESTLVGNTTTFERIASIGRISIPRVYKAGALQATPADYSIVYKLVNWKTFTIIDFVADPGTNKVTFDATGYEDVGDGSGQTIRSGIQSILHLLTNFAFTNTQGTGAWVDPGSTAIPLNLDSWNRADWYLQGAMNTPRRTYPNVQATYGRETFQYITDRMKAIDYVNQQCASLAIYPYWDEAGKLGVHLFDHREQGVSVHGPFHVSEERQLGDIEQPADPNDVADTVAGKYEYDAAAGNLVHELKVMDLSVPWGKTNDVEILGLSRNEGQVVALIPNATSLDPGWTKVGGAAVHNCIDERPGAADLDQSTIAWPAASVNEFRVTFPRLPFPVLSIVRLEIRYIAMRNGAATNVRAFYRKGGTNYNGALNALNTTFGEFVDNYAQDPATVAAWLKATVDASEAGVAVTNAVADNETFTSLNLRVFFVGEPRQAAMAREILSRLLLLYRRPPPETSIPCDLETFALPISSPVAFSSPEASGPSGLGWGKAAWSRRRHQLFSKELDLNTMQVRLRALDTRRILTALWETHRATESTIYANGVARLMANRAQRELLSPPRIFARNSPAWAFDPAGQVYVNVDTDIEQWEPSGLLIEQAGTNKCTRSSFIDSALTGWTVNGAGVNGSSATSNAILSNGVLAMFDSTITDKRVVFVTGTPNTTDLEIVHTGMSVTNAVLAILSFFFFDHPSLTITPYYWLQRASDSKYWRASDNTFQVAKTWNQVTSSVQLSSGLQKFTGLAFDPLANTTFSVGIGAPAASGDGKQMRLYHVQFEDAPAGRGASSPIVTSGGTTTTRAGAELAYPQNLPGESTLPLERFTSIKQFTPGWNSADAGSTDVMVLEEVFGDASNYVSLRYEKSSGNLVARIRVDGVNYDATVAAASFLRGTQTTLAWRLVGEGQELGAAAWTLDVFKDGVKGTSVVAVDPRQYMKLPYTRRDGGQAGGVNCCNGYLRNVYTGPEVWTDVEIQGYP